MSDAQKPVAWMYRCSHDNSVVILQEKQNWADSGSGLWTEAALYTAPPKFTPPDGWADGLQWAMRINDMEGHLAPSLAEMSKAILDMDAKMKEVKP
jgi:hypothetical protein